MSDFSERVYAVVSGIPRGETMTYKEVAEAAGSPKAARAVGNILNRNPLPGEIPCHRVIRGDGRAGGYAWGARKKVRLLRDEGAIGHLSGKMHPQIPQQHFLSMPIKNNKR